MRSAVLLILVLAGGTVAAVEPTIELCAEKVRNHPEDLESYRCYWSLSRSGHSDQALRALNSLLAIDPANSKARLYLAAVQGDLGHDQAENNYRQAARGFAVERDLTGETYAWLSIGELAYFDDRIEEAEQAVEQASRIAEASGDPMLQARAWVMSAMIARKRGDNTRGLELLLKAEEAAFPDGLVDLQAGILSAMGFAYWEQGLREKARKIYLRQAELCDRVGMIYFEATARFNVALLSRELVNENRMSEKDYLATVQQAHELAISTGNRSTQARTELLLARVLGGERGTEHAERSLQLARETGNRVGVRESMRFLAYQLWEQEPARRDEAFSLLEESIEDSRRSGNPRTLALGLIGRAGLLSAGGEREDWVGAYREALEAVEKIRDLQPDGTVGARLFSRWAFVYYRFAAKLLDGRLTSPDPVGDLDLALQVVERMRSRVLIDELDRAGAPLRHDPTSPDARQREELLGEIARVQKLLSDRFLGPRARNSALEELERLETEEAAVREALARVDPSFAVLRAPVIPRLEQIQQQLDPDQAILSFQIAPGDDPEWGEFTFGGSWVVLVTHDLADAFRIPDGGQIRDRVTLFLGLCRRRNGSEILPSSRLYEDLLAEPLAAIAPEVTRLIIVPDVHLHYLPFAGLRPDPGGEPLGATHEISQVPSIRLWLQWQSEERASPGRLRDPAVLTFADPESGFASGESGLRTGNPWTEGLQLGPLPHARSEARALVRNVGGTSRALTGSEASERFLKQADLREYGILHFAAHAIVDQEWPERSAIVLAPGETEEDGFLQTREILDIDLRDKVILLSSCRSASGTLLRGEGMLGLARAFFQAGAHAVVGSLWPLRDDEASTLMSALSEQLARGHSLAASVAAVRSTRIRAGAPTDAWAGLVVLGDGDIVPLPGGRPAAPLTRGWLVAGLALVAAAGAAAFVFRKLRR